MHAYLHKVVVGCSLDVLEVEDRGAVVHFVQIDHVVVGVLLHQVQDNMRSAVTKQCDVC